LARAQSFIRQKGYDSTCRWDSIKPEWAGKVADVYDLYFLDTDTLIGIHMSPEAENLRVSNYKNLNFTAQGHFGGYHCVLWTRVDEKSMIRPSSLYFNSKLFSTKVLENNLRKSMSTLRKSRERSKKENLEASGKWELHPSLAQRRRNTSFDRIHLVSLNKAEKIENELFTLFAEAYISPQNKLYEAQTNLHAEELSTSAASLTSLTHIQATVIAQTLFSCVCRLGASAYLFAHLDITNVVVLNDKFIARLINLNSKTRVLAPSIIRAAILCCGGNEFQGRRLAAAASVFVMSSLLLQSLGAGPLRNAFREAVSDLQTDKIISRDIVNLIARTYNVKKLLKYTPMTNCKTVYGLASLSDTNYLGHRLREVLNQRALPQK
jgi:hypothetical protein